MLISYPLHPPGKPEKLRTEHFPALAVPCLFVSGDRDAFGTPDELEAATRAIPGPVTHVWIERGSHALDRVDDKIVDAVLLAARDVHVDRTVGAARVARPSSGLSTSSSMCAVSG